MPCQGARRLARPTVTVDLAALLANWRDLRARVGAAECAAVVKANAYGLGAERIAPALHAAGCRTFFVATCEEGVSLRRVIPLDSAILVLNGPVRAECPALRESGLEPVLSTLEQVEVWSREAPSGACALQVNAGMNRLGLDEAGLAAVLVAHGTALAPRHLIAHLSTAENPAAAANVSQLDRFRVARRKACHRWPQIRSSLANSSGIFLGEDYWFDLVRPGAALYGVNPQPGRANPMRPVVQFHAPILQVMTLKEPGAVGYGGEYAAARGARLATVAVGYADGYSRSLSSRGYGAIDGVTVPIAGRVSMDLTTFDVSAVPESVLNAATCVELYGAHSDIDELATVGGTIAYELLSRLAGRVHRVYEGNP